MPEGNGGTRMENKEGYIIKKYLKEHIGYILYYTMIVMFFLIVAALYGYDKVVINMLYAVMLSGFFGMLIGIKGYISYRKRCRELFYALENSEESAYYLPEAASLPEELYADIVRLNDEKRRKLIFRLDGKQKDMSDYYTMWTHQIKTPIAAMRLVLRREQEENGGRKGAKQAEEELFKIEQYADMALHYARLDSIASDMLFEQYDINVIIKRAVKKYSILFIGSGLSFSLGELECGAVTDEKWLGFVIEQLLSNALKYTAKGGIRIYGADKAGREIEGFETKYVVIEDTGIGIRENDLPRIFERGFTGYNGRLDKKSTGIGLYLCKQIIDRLSHSIEVESEEGVGTKVILGFCQERYNVTEL